MLEPNVPDRSRRLMTCLCVPEVSGQVVTLLTELNGDYFMHSWATSLRQVTLQLFRISACCCR